MRKKEAVYEIEIVYEQENKQVEFVKKSSREEDENFF